MISYILVIVLIALSAFFSSSETAISSANRIRLKHKASEGDRRAERALSVMDSFDRALSAILIGNNVVNIAASSLATVICISLVGSAYGPVLSTVVITVVVLIFGEVLPKSYAKENADQMAVRVSGVLKALMILLTPFVAALSALRRLMSKVVGHSEETPSVTEEELKYMIGEIENEGVLEKEESELVAAALDFDDITAGEVLTPRVDVAAVPLDADLLALRQLFTEGSYSRLPVYDKTLDNIVGALHSKDVFRLLLTDRGGRWQDLIQEVLFVPPGKKIAQLLNELQKRKFHMAVVTDQYGGTLGIITMEDILEELVGEIWDETDEVVTELHKVGEREYLASADMRPEDLFEALGCTPPEGTEDLNTLGAWVLEQMEKIPDEGDGFACGSLTVTVERVQDNRIQQLRILSAPPEADDTEDAEK